ncbi:MAG: thiamine-phosphate kinase [Firmicutes bacterium]|nr:thiamine-phosphate kinase [Bacillota bacterium]
MTEGSTSLRSVGEFGLIERFRKYGSVRSGVLAGIGDDAAVLEGREGYVTLLTTDMLTEGVHFLRDRVLPYQLGRKSMACNVSDIAAMGGYPTFAVVSLGLPADLTVEFVEEFYRGLAEEAGRWGATVVGGDTVESQGGLVINVALLGEVEAGRQVLRSTARAGDTIYVTNVIGESAAGLAAILDPEMPLPPPIREELILRHYLPTPRVPEAREISQRVWASAMADISDGIAGDLRRICEASGVGAVVYAERVPVSAGVKMVAGFLGKEAYQLALTGGEDYELLFTAKAGDLPEYLPESGTRVTSIGEIRPLDEGLILVPPGGETAPLPAGGYDHF